MSVFNPIVDARVYSDLLRALREMVPHFTPEWPASNENDPGVALVKIFSIMTETLIDRLNQKPYKNFVAFLDMLGIKLLPAQSARAPLTFKLAKGTENDILIPARTQASAAKTEEHEELPFETEENLLATTSNMQEIISVDPFADAIFVHTANVLKDNEILEEQKTFTLFSGTNQQEHSLYLGHKDLFNIEGSGNIFIDIRLSPGGSGDPSLKFKWEYWGEDKIKEKDDWIELEIQADGTAGLSQNGQLVLSKTTSGKVKEEKLEDIFKKTARAEIKSKEFKEKKNRWVRCVLTSPLSITSNLKLPVLDTVFTKSAPLTDIPPDAAFFNDVPLEFPQKKLTTKVIQCSDIDIEEDDEFICVESTEGFNADDAIEIFRNGDSVGLAIIIKVEVDPPKVKVEGTRPIVGDFIHKLSKIRPFGIQPRIYDAVYIASQEAFSKKDSEITLSLLLDHEDTSKGLEPKPNPKLSWEYWNGKGWQVIRELQDGTSNFINQDHQKVFFTIPEDFQQIEVSGQKNYWIRARIVGGDYGRDEYTITDKKIITAAPKYKIPIIYDLKLGYEFKERVELQQSLTYNNLDFQDVTEASRKKGEPITPFTRTEDENRNFYLGFSRKLVGGPIRIFFSAKELEFAEATKPKVDWNYRRKDRWFVLDYRDETEGFITQGHLDFIGQSDFTEFSLFGQSCYWLQGSHVKGSYDSLPEIYGIYPNTTWAIQAETIKDEILGSSNGEPNQSFSFLKTPVIEGQEIRIRETLSNEERQSLMKLKGENSIFEVKDEKGKVLETWILWKEVPGFFDSKANSRHYTLDRALGQIQFGNGTNGMIPPGADDNVRAFTYQAGGTAKGNVKAREIKSLKSAVAGVEKVSNFVAADGGANTATLDEMLNIGPAMISHRNRAITTEDFEALSKMASRKISKVRVLPNTNNLGKIETGWVTAIVVPDSRDPEPRPSLELKRKVQRFLAAHCDHSIGIERHVFVEGPKYVKVGVLADVYVISVEVASEVERDVKRKLNTFFHPLFGGPEGNGWEFGRDVAASDVYSVLESIKGVDHIENLIFQFDGSLSEQIVPIPRNYLVANGEHLINIRLATY